MVLRTPQLLCKISLYPIKVLWWCYGFFVCLVCVVVGGVGVVPFFFSFHCLLKVLKKEAYHLLYLVA